MVEQSSSPWKVSIPWSRRGVSRGCWGASKHTLVSWYRASHQSHPTVSSSMSSAQPEASSQLPLCRIQDVTLGLRTLLASLTLNITLLWHGGYQRGELTGFSSKHGRFFFFKRSPGIKNQPELIQRNLTRLQPPPTQKKTPNVDGIQLSWTNSFVLHVCCLHLRRSWFYLCCEGPSFRVTRSSAQQTRRCRGYRLSDQAAPHPHTPETHFNISYSRCTQQHLCKKRKPQTSHTQ